MVDKKGYEEQLESGVIKSEEQAIIEQEETVAYHEKLLELSERELKATKIDLGIAIEFPKRLVPEYEFQEQEAYWENQKELRKIQLERSVMDKEVAIKNLTKVLNAKVEELQRMKGE